MQRVVKVPALLFFSAALVFPAAAALAYKAEALAPQTKVTIDEARTAALHAVPGTIIDDELEKESGGSGLRYFFDIKYGLVIREIGIDARTGKLLENSLEGAKPD